MSTKGSGGGGGGVAALLISIVVVIFISWMVLLGSRECTKDSQCDKGEYCTSNFECKEVPVKQKVVYEINLGIPAIILSVAIIIAAFVFRGGIRKNDLERFIREAPPEHGGH